MSSTLYELTGIYINLMTALEDPDVDSENINDILDAIEDEIEMKADNYAKIIRNYETQIIGIKNELERLTNRKNILEQSIKRLKDNLKMSMIMTNKRKFKTDLFSFNVQKDGGKVPVVVTVDTSELPDDMVIVSEKPNLSKIGEYIEQTGDTKYGYLGERGEHIVIK